MKVLLLTEQEKDLLVNKSYTNDSYFNPIQDIDDNWVISLQERDFCTNVEFMWINTLQLIDYIPKQVDPF